MPQAAMQSRLDEIYKQQERADYGPGRYAIFFKPGTYKLDIHVAYFMQVAGLGLLPDDVTIDGHVQSRAFSLGGSGASRSGWSVLGNFWRSAENMHVIPPDGADHWAVSQAAPYRRMHVQGNLFLTDNGPGSGGFIADTRIDGAVEAASQQQWFTRNSSIQGWKGGIWNLVFVGVDGAPPASPQNLRPPAPNTPPSPVISDIPEAPISREKPFLYLDKAGAFRVFVPALERNSKSITWQTGNPPGKSLPLNRFFLAKPSMTAAEMNQQLGAGKNLILTPGIYHVTEPIRVTHRNTIVMGLGLATIESDNGTAAMTVADVGGVQISGILFNAGPNDSPNLLEVGPPGASKNHSSDPTFLYDIFARIGGRGPRSAEQSVVINSRDVVGDDLWLWRADHGPNVGWKVNTAKNGLVVNGGHVTMYGLFVEHYQQYQVLWNGDYGRVFFFQNEIPYDPPSQSDWMAGSTQGYAAFKLADTVTHFEGWGMGSYIYEPRHPDMVLAHSFQAPEKPSVVFHNLVTFSLGGGRGIIEHVINGYGPTARKGSVMAVVPRYPPQH